MIIIFIKNWWCYAKNKGHSEKWVDGIFLREGRLNATPTR